MTDMELVQSQLTALQERQEALMRIPRIKKYLGVVEKHVQDNQNRSMTFYEKRNVAQCLYNAVIDTGLKAGTKLFEATTEDSIEFLGVQLPVIAALLPSLALSEIAVVQAMDRRIAAVFYLDVKYGTAKGNVAAGEVMIGAKSGHEVGKSGRRYAMARVVDENIGTGNGAKIGTVDYDKLIHLDNVKLEKVANIGTINEIRTTLGTSTVAGVITGSYVTGNGSINAAGGYNVTIKLLDSTDIVYITYDYQYDLVEDDYGNKTGVPEVDVSVTQSTMEAIDFPLRAKYSIGAQIDLQKAHGINLESELVKYLGSEVKFTIDQVGLDMIDDAAGSSDAATGPDDWDARPGLGEPWLKIQGPLRGDTYRKAA